jgi:hypothetical protein
MQTFDSHGNTIKVSGEGTSINPYLSAVGGDLSCFVQAIAAELKASGSRIISCLSWNGTVIMIRRLKNGGYEVDTLSDPQITTQEILLSVMKALLKCPQS